MFYNFIIIFILFLSAQTSFACSTCLSGDPTLTLMGTEKAYQGRFRIELEGLYREEEVGKSGFNLKELEESRFTLGLAYAFNEKISISFRLPYVNKTLTNINLAEEESHALGDIDFTTKFTFSPHNDYHTHLYGVLLGAKLPSATEQEEEGNSLDIDVQPGTGSLIPKIGGWYGYYNYPWFFYTSHVAHITANKGFQDYEAGNALVSTFQLQYAFHPNIATSLGLDTRWSAKDSFDGEKDDDSGGFIGFITPRIITHITEDFLLHASIQIPVINSLNGDHEEKTIYQIGFTYDF